MNYIGNGKLIAYHTYTKDNKQRHVYNVLNGTMDSASGLYSECEYITIIQDTQTLKELKPQSVTFEVAPRMFNGKTYNSFTNIREAQK